MWKFPRKFSLMITLSQIPVSLLIAVEKYGLLATLLICTARDNVTVGSWNSTSSLGSCTQHYRMSQIQLKLWIVSIVVFASFQVCNYERFIREGKIKEDKLPSSLMYLQKLLRSTQPGSEYRRAISSSNRARTQSQAGARGPGAVRWPSHFFWSLHGTMSSASVPEDSRPRGSHWFPFHSSARRTAEQWGRKDRHYWKGSSCTSAFCQHQKAPMWAETRYAENLPEALNYRATSSIHSHLLWNKHSALPLPPRLLDAQKSNTTAPILKNAGAQSTRWEKHQL